MTKWDRMDYFWLQRTPAVLHPPNPHRTCCRSDQSSHPTTQKSGRNCGTRARRPFWGQLSTVKLVGSGWQWIDLASYQWAPLILSTWKLDFCIRLLTFCSFCILPTSSLLKRQLSPYGIPGTVTERLKLLCIHWWCWFCPDPSWPSSRRRDILVIQAKCGEIFLI